jgi:hypothetical protein
MLDLQDIGTTPLVPGVFGPTDSKWATTEVIVALCMTVKEFY